MIRLWAKAAKAQSTTWRVVGPLREKGTKDVSELTVSAGPGIRLVITSREKGTVAYNIASAEMGRFEQALNHVREFLSRAR